MPTTNERKALWFLAFVALSGSGVRVWRSNTPPPTVREAAALERQIRRADSARSNRQKRPSSSTRASKAAAPSEPAVPVDLDRASALELQSLPGIGPALAGRIVAHRDSAGEFGSLDGLCEVRGVGPALAERLRPLVTFSAPPRPLSVACGESSKRSRKSRGTRAREQR